MGMSVRMKNENESKVLHLGTISAYTPQRLVAKRNSYPYGPRRNGYPD